MLLEAVLSGGGEGEVVVRPIFQLLLLNCQSFDSTQLAFSSTNEKENGQIGQYLH